MSKITYSNKSDINTTATPDVNKVTAGDFNEIKTVVNNNDDTLTNTNVTLSNIKGTVLWTNPNPTASFSEQYINLSSSDYDVLEFYYRSDTATNFTFCQKLLKGFGTQFVYSSQGSGSRHWIRRIYWVSNTQFSCADCVRVDGTSTSNGNEQDVPLYVVGYKTGLF